MGNLKKKTFIRVIRFIRLFKRVFCLGLENEIGNLVKENLEESRRKQKSYYGRDAENLNFEVGDLVLLKERPKPGLSRKLTPKFMGPFRAGQMMFPNVKVSVKTQSCSRQPTKGVRKHQEPILLKTEPSPVTS